MGIESLPRVIARLEEIRTQLEAPPPPPNLPPLRWHYVNGTLHPFYPMRSSGHRGQFASKLSGGAKGST